MAPVPDPTQLKPTHALNLFASYAEKAEPRWMLLGFILSTDPKRMSVGVGCLEGMNDAPSPESGFIYVGDMGNAPVYSDDRGLSFVVAELVAQALNDVDVRARIAAGELDDDVDDDDPLTSR